MEHLRKQWPAALVVLSLATYGYLGYGLASRTQFVPLLTGYAGLFIAYVLLVRQRTSWSGMYPTIGIIARLILFFAFPLLSDDLYRFIWDGRLLAGGENPFLHLPSHYLTLADPPQGIDQALYDQLNSPQYFTVYPPIHQLFFYTSGLFGHSLYASTLILKLPILLAECGTIWLLPRLLRQLQLPSENAAWYTLNPLVIIELCGNLHFEGVMIFFLVLALWWVVRGHWIASAAAFALAVNTKLLPLMFLPFFIRRLGWGRSLLYGLLVGSITALLFWPFLEPALVANFSDSLELYFKTFEFNASIYYVVRWIGYQVVGYNVIAKAGFLLSLLAGGLILATALFERTARWDRLPLRWLTAQTIYYALAVIVHPWYLSTLVLLAAFTRFRYVMVWSGMATLSYVTYRDTRYDELEWLTAIEYLVVLGWLIYEWRWRPAKGLTS